MLSSVILFTFAVLANSQPLIPHGSQQIFDLSNVISMHDLKSSSAHETGYTLKSQLKINSVWHSEKEQLLQVYISDATVSTTAKDGKRKITQPLTKLPDRPFYISLVNDIPKKVIAHTSKDQSLLNLERGIASLLQIQFRDGPITEIDVSGKCNAFYKQKSSTKIEKTKTDCSHWDLKVNYRPDKPLGVVQDSKELIEFDLSSDGMLQNVKSVETHWLGLAAKPDVGSRVASEFQIKHNAVGQTDNVEQLNFSSLDDAINSLLEWYRVFDIEADVDGAFSEMKSATLKKQIAKNTKFLADDSIGTESLALFFVQILPYARITKQAEFVSILKTYKKLRNQLVDLLGAVQTIDSHKAITEVFAFEDNSNADLLEKYLQSLAVGTHPDRVIIEDLFERISNTERPIENEKLRDTMIQTVASLTHSSGFDTNDELLNKIRAFLLEHLTEKCKINDIACKTMYIRALQNLQDPVTIAVLLKHAADGDAKLNVAAMQALKSFPIVHFKEQHRAIFSQIFFQQQRKVDSSARTLALDILLSLKPSKQQLHEFIDYLASNDREYEIKTYVVQKLQMLADKCPRFRTLLKDCLSEKPNIHNYHIMAQKGLTTVLSRQLSQDPAFNETLLSVQEINKGVLKRGSVELILAAGRDEFSTFKLGIYTGGLSSFVGGDDDESDEDTVEEGPATAGMEISVQGNSLRPLVFFSGQSELMGHVWSGTASDPTPAFQATMLAQDHEQYHILSSGSTVYSRVLGARSVDLNGKVSFSLWNRNANTEIKQDSAAAVVGHMTAGFSQYAQVANEFVLTNTPKISLLADIDFYSEIKLCMQLQRPEMIVNHTNSKSVQISGDNKPYSKKVIRKFKHYSAGSTLALNQKNNDMCNMIFPE